MTAAPREIRFGDLAREYRSIRAEIDEAVARVLASGWFVLGPEVEAFERAFAHYVGAPYCLGVASGTDAIALALKALGVGSGDEVITVSHTAVPTISAISMALATPVLVDIDPDTYLMDVRQVEATINSRTRAIVPVHLYGQPVDMDPLLEIAERHGIPIVEDCAQSHGARYKGRMTGTMGIAAAFSFYPSKNLGCYGDGGAIVTADPALAEQVRKLRNYGQRERYYNESKGVNSRLDELQAAILCAKLPHLEHWNLRRKEIARMYTEGLSGLQARTPIDGPYADSAYHLYVIAVSARDELRRHLAEREIQTLIHYPVPAHLQQAYADLGYSRGSFPSTETAADSILSLPLYPQLSDDEVHHVIARIREFIS